MGIERKVWKSCFWGIWKSFEYSLKNWRCIEKNEDGDGWIDEGCWESEWGGVFLFLVWVELGEVGGC